MFTLIYFERNGRPGVKIVQGKLHYRAARNKLDPTWYKYKGSKHIELLHIEEMKMIGLEI